MTDAPITDPPAPDTELGAAGKRALDAERAARHAAETKLRETEGRLADLETAGLRREVAAEKGLSDAQVAHITGSTKEEMAAAADELLAAFAPSASSAPPSRRPTADLRGGLEPGTDVDSAAAIADRILGRGI